MLRPGATIILCVLALLSIGVIAVNSAGLSVSAESAVTFRSIAMARPTILMIAAFCCLLLTSILPVRRLAERLDLGQWMLLGYLLLLSVVILPYIPGVSHEAKGAMRWVTLPVVGQTMQPSELAKWGLVIILAWYGARNASLMHRFRTGILVPLTLTGVIVALIGYQDLGTAVLIAGVASLMLVAAGARITHFLPAAPAGIALAVVAVMTSDYRMRRITSFMDPYADPQGDGYHLIQSLVAIANGQGAGRGLGFGLQKFDYLPEDRTDFLFAVICEELGVAGAAIVAALFLAILWTGWRIAMRQTNVMLRLIAFGVIATFGLQALMNLLVVTGLVPTKGIALPLLSSGGTGWIVTAASLGLLVAMDRAAASEPEVASDVDEGAEFDIEPILA